MFAASATKKQPKNMGRQEPQTHNENDGNITQSENGGEDTTPCVDKGKIEQLPVGGKTDPQPTIGERRENRADHCL